MLDLNDCRLYIRLLRSVGRPGSKVRRILAPARLAGFIVFFAAWVLVVPGYTPEQNNVNGPVPDRWQGNAVTWHLNPNTGSNVNTSGGEPVASVLTNAFAAWTSTPLNGELLTNLTVTQGANSNLTDPNSQDCTNVISFVPSSAVSLPTGSIAFTAVASVSLASGAPPFSYTCSGQSAPRQCNFEACIIDADIVFNPNENFSTSTPPLSSHFDVQSIATHEIGHLLGLDHSGIASTVMDPYGDVGSSQERSLALDDTIGIGFLYPASGFSAATGTIQGTITQNGTGIFGSHVIATNAADGVVTVDGLTDTHGNYSLAGLPPGDYNVLALPLSGPYSISDFGGWYCGYSTNSQPCCDPNTDKSCSATQTISNPTNYTGKFH